MEIPQVTWAEVPWWVWVLVVLPVWYVVIGRSMAAGWFDTEPTGDEQEKAAKHVTFWLLSPVLIPIGLAIIGTVLVFTATKHATVKGVKWACVVIPPDPEARKDAGGKT